PDLRADIGGCGAAFARNLVDAADTDQRVAAALECLANAGRQHRAAGRLPDCAPQLLHERICIRTAQREHEARLRTKLADAERERREESLRNCVATLLERTGQQEYRVDAAHLREDRDRVRPRIR